MKLQRPKPNESYKVMIWNALVKKTKANLRSKKPSQRDGVREHNATHHTQVSLRGKLAPASLYTHTIDKDGQRVGIPSVPSDSQEDESGSKS